LEAADTGEYFGYVWNLIETAATHLDNMEAGPVSEVVLEAVAALWSLTMALYIYESIWNLMEVAASLCSLVEAGHIASKRFPSTKTAYKTIFFYHTMIKQN
jgi:hypothetical protein